MLTASNQRERERETERYGVRSFLLKHEENILLEAKLKNCKDKRTLTNKEKPQVKYYILFRSKNLKIRI